MSSARPKSGKSLLFFCTRQKPGDFAGFHHLIFGDGKADEIEVPCSGRVGTGELMQGLAAGYDKVVVLSCGEKSCRYGFGCSEAKKSMSRAREVAKVAGIDAKRLVFIEADEAKREGEE